jgi:ribosomal protein S18 acetylase RimI-like enzyme
MISLRQLTSDEISTYFDQLWIDYKAELLSAGFSAGYADENLESSKKNTFTDGVLNPGNYIFYAYSNNDSVGKLWITSVKRDGKSEWSIYDIETWTQYRGRGFGRAIMKAAEEFVREQGGDSITLSVFGNNTSARKLYESLGYETIRVGMKKRIN